MVAREGVPPTLPMFWSVLFYALTIAAQAQTVSTQILGLVKDPSGGVIIGAKVTARHVATRDLRNTESNETGNYVFPLLEIGEYEITCSAPGFKSEILRGINLQLQEKARVDCTLQVGDQQETVDVKAPGLLLRTEDATLGSVIDHKRIVEF